MNVGGILISVGVATAVVYFFGNYRGRYGESRIGIRGAFVVAVIGICLTLAWQWLT